MSDIQVLVVEDEYIALEHLTRLIEERAEGFSVVGTAHDGYQALEMVAQHVPDLIVTDIHMPGMDGLSLLKAIFTEYPFINVVMVSGFQDFDLVKEALTTGALDYILKPLSPTKIQQAFSSIRTKIEAIHLETRKTMLTDLAAGNSIEKKALHHLFPADRYLLAVHRQGGLPNRMEHASYLHRTEADEPLLILSGRDEIERYYLYPAIETYCVTRFKHLVQQKIKAENPSSSSTSVFLTEPFQIESFAKRLKEVLFFLDTHVVLEEALELCWDGVQEAVSPAVLDDEQIQLLTVLLQDNRFEDFKQRISGLLEEWKSKRRPQFWIFSMIQQIVRLMLRIGRYRQTNQDYDRILEQSFVGVSTYDQLGTRIEAVLTDIITNQYGTFQRMDTPEFFQHVEAYIMSHCDQPLTLHTLTTRFGISQTYLSRLFRKYAGVSCNEFVTRSRIRRACELMQADPTLRIKDVALLVGYKDQFYFSRLFRQELGVAPSHYLAERVPDNTAT